MKATNPTTIDVPWQSSFQSYSPDRAYLWQWKRQGHGPRSQSKLERSLGWPPGVIDILNSAFAKDLPRSYCWNLANIHRRMDQEAFRIAAQVFRRGVATSLTGEVQRTTQGSYPIRFLNSQDEMDAFIDRTTFVVVDKNVETAWPYLEDKHSFTLDTPSEHEKDLAHIGKLLSAWEAAGKPKDWIVIGGGLSSDLVGFAAGLVNCRLSIMPTTLLAMVDASVGGKSAVNYPPYGKNQVGAFNFPQQVLIWPDWLQTVTQRGIRSGGAECLKHAILMKSRNKAKSLAKALASIDLTKIAEFLPPLIAFKASVVAVDPYEMGQRAILNLGHTMGHALEAVSSDAQSYNVQMMEHGEAVAFGICFSALLSQRLGILSEDDRKFIWELFRSSQCLPNRKLLASYLGQADLNDEDLWTQLHLKLQQDKKQTKAQSTNINFVLLEAIGKVHKPSPKCYITEVNPKQIRACWKQFVKLLA